MPNSFSCIIVDDEQDAVELLTDRIGRLFNNVIISKSCYDWTSALQCLKEKSYDIIFMDINIPGKSGLDLLKLLPNIEGEIIFVTAHEHYALDAFSFSATGYVLKPINDEALYAAINKATGRIENKRLATHPKSNNTSINSKIGIPNNHGIDYINISEILYLESTNKCTRIVTSKSVYTSTSNIGKFREIIDDESFFQIHRSFVINLNCILRYESTGVVVMTDKMEIPVSRNVKNEFLKIFNSYS